MANSTLTAPNNRSTAPRLWESELLILRGDDRTGLRASIDALLTRLDRDAELTEIAHDLSQSLQPGGCRLAIIASSIADAKTKLGRARERVIDPTCTQLRDNSGVYFTVAPLAPAGKVAFLFPGEGAQYVGMLRDVAQAFPVVGAFFAACDDNARSLGERPLTTIFLPPVDASAAMKADCERELRRIDQAMLSVMMADWALFQLFGQLGLHADVMAGHSMGELAALWAAGAVQSADELLPGLQHAMRAMQEQEERASGEFGLLAVGIGRGALADLLRELGQPPVTVAMDNCPHQAVVVGPSIHIDQIEAELRERRVMCERLPFRQPYHTADFEPCLAPVREMFAAVPFAPPELPVYSCTTARPFPSEPALIRELALSHWASPVRFTEMIENLYAAGARIFVEVGPRGNLSAFVEDILRGQTFLAAPANIARRAGLTQLLHMLGQLLIHHVPMQLDALFAGRITPPAPAAAIPEPSEPAPITPPAMMPPTPTTTPRSHRAAVLSSYFEVMNQFLDLQREMTEQFLTHRPAPRPRVAVDPPAPPAPRPLVGEILLHVPGRELVMRRPLDLAEDTYAIEHTVGGREISRIDRSHVGVPVVPMTFTLEMMAEAASVLVPGKIVVGLRNVKLYRWLAFDDDVVGSIELKARIVGTDADGSIRVEGEVKDLSNPKGPLAASTATVILADRYPAPSDSVFRLDQERPAALSVEQTYRNLFHGPQFQGVRSNDRVGSAGIESRMEILPRERLFRSHPQPNWCLDPVMLDVSMHPLAAWHLEQPDQAGRILLPVGVDAVELYGPPPAVGTKLFSRGWVSKGDARAFTHEGEIVHEDGTLHLRLIGVKCWRFYVPFGQVNFHGPKDLYFLSERWEDAGEPFDIMRLDPPLDLQQPAMSRVTAQVTLTPTEMRQFRQQQREGGNPLDALFERIIAKDALRKAWTRRTGERLFLADLEAEKRPDGRFQFHQRGGGGPNFPLVAIAKSGTQLAAIAGSDPAIAFGDSESSAVAACRSEGTIHHAPDGDQFLAWAVGPEGAV